MIDLFETTRPKIRPEFLELAEKGMELVNGVFNDEFLYELDNCWTRMPWFDRIHYVGFSDGVILSLVYKDEYYYLNISLNISIRENSVWISINYENVGNIYKIYAANLSRDDAKSHISDMLKDARQTFRCVDDGSIIDGEEVYHYDDIGHEVNKVIAHYEKSPDRPWSCVIDCAGYPIYDCDFKLVPTKHWDTEA